jgi:hypothetical protein
MWDLWWTKWHWDRFFPPEYFGFPCQFHSTCAALLGKMKKLIIFIIGLHNKPQGCGVSVASAVMSFTTKKNTTYVCLLIFFCFLSSDTTSYFPPYLPRQFPSPFRSPSTSHCLNFLDTLSLFSRFFYSTSKFSPPCSFYSLFIPLILYNYLAHRILCLRLLTLLPFTFVFSILTLLHHLLLLLPLAIHLVSLRAHCPDPHNCVYNLKAF